MFQSLFRLLPSDLGFLSLLTPASQQLSLQMVCPDYIRAVFGVALLPDQNTTGLGLTYSPDTWSVCVSWELSNSSRIISILAKACQSLWLFKNKDDSVGHSINLSIPACLALCWMRFPAPGWYYYLPGNHTIITTLSHGLYTMLLPTMHAMVGNQRQNAVFLYALQHWNSFNQTFAGRTSSFFLICYLRLHEKSCQYNSIQRACQLLDAKSILHNL